jgi:histidine ammonia-lyase
MAMLELDGKHLTLTDLLAVAHDGQGAILAEDARTAVERARNTLEEVLETGKPLYGVNTGFGDLSHVRIPAEKAPGLQRRLLLSHAAGVGEPLPPSCVRSMLLLRANALARGYSGIRAVVIDRILEMLNRNLLPVVPSRGSVGASGDLAPVEHLALPLIGHGRLDTPEGQLDAATALSEAGLEPLELGAKEGLALINGTQAMTALLALGIGEARKLARSADLIGALATDALRGADTAFDRRIHALRPHPGQRLSAANLWNLLQGSNIRDSHREEDVRVQDPYCVRCMPQVHGAARDVIEDAARKVEIEINAVTDNPLVFPDEGEILSGGNFHGEPMAIAADTLAIAIAELGAISERRIDKLTDATFSGLPPFLVQESGLNSGFMIAQVTAAALASESKIFCHPASVDSIPTSAGKEDHVSMGVTSALKLGPVLDNTRTILAIELLAAAQGVDLLRPLESSAPLERLHAALRTIVPAWIEDREMSPDIEAAVTFTRQQLPEHLNGLD